MKIKKTKKTNISAFSPLNNVQFRTQMLEILEISFFGSLNTAGMKQSNYKYFRSKPKLAILLAIHLKCLCHNYFLGAKMQYLMIYPFTILKCRRAQLRIDKSNLHDALSCYFFIRILIYTIIHSTYYCAIKRERSLMCRVDFSHPSFIVAGKKYLACSRKLDDIHIIEKLFHIQTAMLL